MRPRDTSPEAHRVQMQVYRRMGGARRLALALELGDGLHATVCAGIRARHPEYDERTVTAAAALLRLGPELYRAAWPGRPLYDP